MLSRKCKYSESCVAAMKLSGDGKPLRELLRDLLSSRSGRERRGDVGILSEGWG